MPSALGYGLMGGAAAFLGAKGQQIEQEQVLARETAYEEAKTERLMRANALQQETLARIAAEKDERKFEQSKELKGMELSAAEKRAKATQDAANARAEKSNETRLAAANISANRPRGEGSKPRPSYRTAELPDGSGWGYVDLDTGEFRKSSDGEFVKAAPPYRERSGGATKAEPKAADKAAAGSSKDNPLDATATNARPPSGTWVRLPSGAVVQVP